MDSDSMDEIGSLSRSSSSSCSLPSSLGLYEPSMYSDNLFCTTNPANESNCVQLPNPIYEQTNYLPLVICDKWCEELNGNNNNAAKFCNTLDAPLDREGLPGWHQYPAPPFLGTQCKTHMQAIQSLERELYFWKNECFHLMQEKDDLKLKAHMLEKRIMVLKAGNQDLMACNYQLTIQAWELRNKVDNLEFKDAQRDLSRVDIRFAELKDQMLDLEAEFTELKDEVKQFMAQFFSPETKVLWLTYVNKLEGAISEFKGCWDDMTKNITELNWDVCKLKARVENLEMSDILLNSSVAELMLEVTHQEMEISQFHARVSRLNGQIVQLKKTLEILEMEQEEEMEKEEASIKSTTEAGKSKHLQSCLVECMRFCKQRLLNCSLFNGILKPLREKYYELVQEEAFDEEEIWDGTI